MVAGSGFDVALYSIWLDSVEFDGGSVTLSFRTDAPGAASTPLEFTLSRSGLETQSVFAEALAVSGECATGQLIWYGFVTGGDMEALVDWLTSSPQSLTAQQHTIEPALIQNLDNTYVRSVNLANRQRVRTTDIPGVERPIIVNTRCLQGPLRFKEGVNTRISYDLSRNGLVIAAGVGQGEGETCEELPQFEGEVSPDGGSLLSGGPTCNQVIKTVNGLVGPRVSLRGGPGIRIDRDPDVSSRLILTLDQGSLHTCQTGGAG